MADKNKISVITPIYNTAEFVGCALNSIRDFADEIIIVEGAWNPTVPKRSSDGSIDIIEEFKAKNQKKTRIIYYDSDPNLVDNHTFAYVPTAFANQIRAKQIAAQYMTGDWFFMVDADEVYKQEDLEKLDDYLAMFKELNDPLLFRINAFVFYFNINFGTEEPYQRISRILEFPPRLNLEDQVQYDATPIQIDIPDDIIKMYHYGYIGTERVKAKMSLWRPDYSDEWFENVFMKMIESNELEDGKNYHLFAEAGMGQAFKHFEGEHPLVIQEWAREALKVRTVRKV